jgi:hypothetical protein
MVSKSVGRRRNFTSAPRRTEPKQTGAVFGALGIRCQSGQSTAGRHQPQRLDKLSAINVTSVTASIANVVRPLSRQCADISTTYVNWGASHHTPTVTWSAPAPLVAALENRHTHGP